MYKEKKDEDFSYAAPIFCLNSKNWDMLPDALYLLKPVPSISICA